MASLNWTLLGIMPKILRIGIEINFGILKDRGLESAPVLIEKILVENGFHIDWTDPSHIVAMRNT